MSKVPRNLDGVFYRVQRGDWMCVVCYSDMTADERKAIIYDRMDERPLAEQVGYYRRLAELMADQLYDMGELLSLAEIVDVSVAYSSICTGGERTSDERGTCHEVRIDRFWRGCSECGFNWEILHSVVGGSRPNYCPKCGAKVVDE